MLNQNLLQKLRDEQHRCYTAKMCLVSQQDIGDILEQINYLNYMVVELVYWRNKNLKLKDIDTDGKAIWDRAKRHVESIK